MTSLLDKMHISGLARTMSDFWPSQDDVGKAGERLLSCMAEETSSHIYQGVLNLSNLME